MAVYGWIFILEFGAGSASRVLECVIELGDNMTRRILVVDQDSDGRAALPLRDSGLEAAQRGLRTAVSKLSEARLQETVPGQESTYWYLLQGIMNHDLYHTGQISLLKKGL